MRFLLFLLVLLRLLQCGADALRHLSPWVQLPQQPAFTHAHPHAGQTVRLPLLQPPLQPVVHAEEPRPAAHRRAALQVSRVPERVLAARGPQGAPEERAAQTGGARRRRALSGVPSPPTDDGHAPPACTPDAHGAPHPYHGAMMTDRRRGQVRGTTLHFRFQLCKKEADTKWSISQTFQCVALFVSVVTWAEVQQKDVLTIVFWKNHLQILHIISFYSLSVSDIYHYRPDHLYSASHPHQLRWNSEICIQEAEIRDVATSVHCFILPHCKLKLSL